MKLILIINFLTIIYSNIAYAYIDPGFIAGFFNLIVASLASLAVFFIFKPYFYIKNFLKKIFKKKDLDKDKNK